MTNELVDIESSCLLFNMMMPCRGNYFRAIGPLLPCWINIRAKGNLRRHKAPVTSEIQKILINLKTVYIFFFLSWFIQISIACPWLRVRVGLSYYSHNSRAVTLNDIAKYITWIPIICNIYLYLTEKTPNIRKGVHNLCVIPHSGVFVIVRTTSCVLWYCIMFVSIVAGLNTQSCYNEGL